MHDPRIPSTNCRASPAAISSARRPRASAALRSARCSSESLGRARPQAASAPSGAAQRPALPAARQARHLPVPSRRPVAAGSVRLQAAAQRARTASSCPTTSAAASGSPACRPSRRRFRSPARSSSSPSTANRARGSASCLPHHREIVDDVCFVKSMFTEAINHDPAITFFQTGSQIAGRPSMGAWLSYGLGSMNDDLPSFIVLVSANQADQPLYARLWGSGFLDSKYQGVQFRPGKDPGALPQQSRRHLPLRPRRDARQAQRAQPPSVRAGARPGDRIADRAVRNGVPHADERAGGDRPRRASRNRRSSCTAPTAARRARSRPTACWPAGWPSAACDSFSSIIKAGTITAACPTAFATSAQETDQASAALVIDLKQRGLLDDTLVDLGRRVRPHVLLARHAHRHRLRPRPSPALLHHLARRRRRQAGLHLRPHRRLRLQHRRRRRQRRSRPPRTSSRPAPSTSTTCKPRSCTCWASTTRSSRSNTRAATTG